MNRFLRLAGILCTLCVLAATSAFAQTRVGYVASLVIRERFPEAQQVNQRIETVVGEWKKNLEERQTAIDNLQVEIQKNRLIWGDEERRQKEDQLQKLKTDREEFARLRFGPEGEFDRLVSELYRPIEAKIFAAIQDVANSDGYDIIWDKSTQPLVYVNPRYDITVKVMERLGIPVDDLRAQQEEAVKNDPRNQEKESTSSSRRRSRSRSRDTDKEQSKQDPVEQPATDQEIPRE